MNIDAGIKVLKKASAEMIEKINEAREEYRVMLELAIPLIVEFGELELEFGVIYDEKCNIENVENVAFFIKIINFMKKKSFNFDEDHFIKGHFFTSYTQFYIGAYRIESNLFDISKSKNKHIYKNGDEVILTSSWETYEDFMDFIEVCRV